MSSPPDDEKDSKTAPRIPNQQTGRAQLSSIRRLAYQTNPYSAIRPPAAAPAPAPEPAPAAAPAPAPAPAPIPIPVPAPTPAAAPADEAAVAKRRLRQRRIIYVVAIVALAVLPYRLKVVGEATVRSASPLIVDVDVSQADISDVFIGQNVLIKLEGYPGSTIEGSVASIGETARSNHGESSMTVEVTVREDLPWAQAGMRGWAKVIGNYRTVGWLAARRISNSLGIAMWSLL